MTFSLSPWRLAKRMVLGQVLLIAFASQIASGIQSPTGVISFAGDQSLILHWERNSEPNTAGYRVYRSTTGTAGPFTLLTATLLTTPGYCDLSGKVINGQTNLYYVTAVDALAQESQPSAIQAVTPRPFASDDDFLEYIQRAHFNYFWYLANPANGLVPDRTAAGSACSIAAVGFGLTAIGIGIDHGWISRSQGAARVRTTLSTFLNGPQGSASSGVIGYQGWFYHFLNMNTALRAGSELSSIDTALLLGGVLYARQYFSGTNADETAIRSMADAIYNRVDWNWMARNGDALSMGWFPGSGFIANNWIGYNEAMILYIMGLGKATNPLPASSWSRWTSGYVWASYYGENFVPFPPLFGHQYSHCWIDFRHTADSYMASHNSTYFENSRRATIAQRAYCIANPLGRVGYSSEVWGLTACDSPGGYMAHGAPPAQSDDGTIAPTAAGGSIAFTPEFSIPALRAFYSRFRIRIWTQNGFRDAFNIGAQWYGPDELGIDQGPILIMIENHRTQRVWRLFMQNAEIQRGLQRAGFAPVKFVPPRLQPVPSKDAWQLDWESSAGRAYQVEFSSDLDAWFASPTGELTAIGSTSSWTDDGPPGTPSLPSSVPQRFYRVFQFGTP